MIGIHKLTHCETVQNIALSHIQSVFLHNKEWCWGIYFLQSILVIIGFDYSRSKPLVTSLCFRLNHESHFVNCASWLVGRLRWLLAWCLASQAMHIDHQEFESHHASSNVVELLEARAPHFPNGRAHVQEYCMSMTNQRRFLMSGKGGLNGKWILFWWSSWNVIYIDDSLIWYGHIDQGKKLSYQFYLPHHYLSNKKKRSLMFKPRENKRHTSGCVLFRDKNLLLHI